MKTGCEVCLPELSVPAHPMVRAGRTAIRVGEGVLVNIATKVAVFELRKRSYARGRRRVLLLPMPWASTMTLLLLIIDLPRTHGLPATRARNDTGSMSQVAPIAPARSKIFGRSLKSKTRYKR